ncbi:MAG: efflux RND transporter periplasmic adaptor subunit [Coxiellaceae bacterium]|nr:efflux RND transporter periplasmic adaptor subunit [Coxiellaceae bacterium]
MINIKRLSIALTSCAVVVGLGYWFWHKPAKVTHTVTAKRMTIQQKVTAVGRIVPKHIVTVKSPLSGTVSQISHDSGDYIKKGTTLLRVKPNPTPQQLAEKLELVARDKAALQGDSQQLKNYSQLLQYKIIGKNYEQYVQALQHVKQDQATLDFDQQNLDLLQKGQTTINGEVVKNIINSPIDGFILNRGVDIGDSVVSLNDMQTATALFIIANMKDLQFKGTVDETDANHLKTGMPADIQIAAMPKKHINGKITLLALQSDQQNQVDNPNAASSSSTSSTTPFNVGFEINIADLKIPDDIKLRSGFSATATIITKSVKHALTVPENALVFKDDKTYVYLLQKNKPAKLQLVTTGISDGLNVQITQGLTDKQTIEIKSKTDEKA